MVVESLRTTIGGDNLVSRRSPNLILLYDHVKLVGTVHCTVWPAAFPLFHLPGGTGALKRSKRVKRSERPGYRVRLCRRKRCGTLRIPVPMRRVRTKIL